jgi:hypothetical protein
MAPINWLSLAATVAPTGPDVLVPMELAKPAILRTAVDFKEFFPAV